MSIFWTVDAAAEQGWAAFRRRLADHVAALADDDILIVETESVAADPDVDDLDGTEPYVQFLAYGGGRIHAEVSSNAWLRPGRQLDEASVHALLALGWTAPADEDEDDDGGNFTADARTSEADRLAEMAVAALRDVFGVPHPAFLLADGLEVQPGTGRYVERTAHEADIASVPDDEPLAVHPADRDELVALVDSALTPVFGHAPQHDEDGDIPVIADNAVVYVRVRQDMPVVEIFCRVVRDVADHDAALFEVNELNNEHPLISFAVVGDSVMAETHIPALPFAPAHVRDLLDMMCRCVDKVAPALARRVGGRVELGEPDPEYVDEIADVDDVDDDAEPGPPAEPWDVRPRRATDVPLPGMDEVSPEGPGLFDAGYSWPDGGRG